MPVQIVFETHATTTDNEAGIATGWLPGRLSAAGRAQARAMGERRGSDGIAAIFSSDLRRAVETVEIAFAGSTVPVFQDARLRECDYGVLNGAPVREIERQRAARIDEPFPEGQSYREVVGQMAQVLGDFMRHWNGSRVLIVAHSANRWALQHLLHGIALEALVTAPFDWQPGWEFTLPSDVVWDGGGEDQGTQPTDTPV